MDAYPVRTSPKAGIRFLWVTGAQRSGTTLVGRLLGGHPDIHFVPTDTVVFDSYDYFARYTGVRQPGTRKELETVCRKLIAHPLVGKWGLSQSDIDCTLDRFEPGWDGAFLTLAYALSEKYPEKIICFKRPMSGSSFARLREIFGQQGDCVRFIYCLRSPFDVYRSWKHRASAWVGRPDTDPRPIFWSSQWLLSTTEALSSSYLLGDLLHIARYEDLIRDTPCCAARLCRFLGIDPARATDMIAALDSIGANTSFPSPDPEPQTGILNTLDRNVPGLSDFEMNVIRAACGRRAATFGYDLGDVDKSVLGGRHVEYDIVIESLPTRALVKSTMQLLLRRTWTRVRPGQFECKADV